MPPNPGKNRIWGRRPKKCSDKIRCSDEEVLILRRLPTFCRCKLLYRRCYNTYERSAGQERAKMGFFFWRPTIRDFDKEKLSLANSRCQFRIKIGLDDRLWLERGPADNQRLGIYVLPYKRAFGLARKCQHWRIDSTILYGQEVGHIPSADDNYRNFIRPWRCTTRSQTVRMAPPAVAAGRIGIQCYIQHVPGKSWWWRRRNHTGDNKVHSIAPLKWHRCGHGTFLPRVRYKKLN